MMPLLVTSAMVVADDDHSTLFAVIGLPEASCAVATSCSDSPGYKPEFAGVTVTLCAGFDSTRITALPVDGPTDAVNVASPGANALTTPFDETAATATREVDHWTLSTGSSSPLVVRCVTVI
jgi:hypothetical protein